MFSLSLSSAVIYIRLHGDMTACCKGGKRQSACALAFVQQSGSWVRADVFVCKSSTVMPVAGELYYTQTIPANYPIILNETNSAFTGVRNANRCSIHSPILNLKNVQSFSANPTILPCCSPGSIVAHPISSVSHVVYSGRVVGCPISSPPCQAASCPHVRMSYYDHPGTHEGHLGTMIQ